MIFIPGKLRLVGASGCGKSTLAKAIVFLDPANRGEVLWEGELMKKENPQQIKQLRKNIQFIFQDPYAALHPLKTIAAAIEEVLLVHTSLTSLERSKRITALLIQVGLSAEFGALPTSTFWWTTSKGRHRKSPRC